MTRILQDKFFYFLKYMLLFILVQIYIYHRMWFPRAGPQVPTHQTLWCAPGWSASQEPASAWVGYPIWRHNKLYYYVNIHETKGRNIWILFRVTFQIWDNILCIKYIITFSLSNLSLSLITAAEAKPVSFGIIAPFTSLSRTLSDDSCCTRSGSC